MHKALSAKQTETDQTQATPAQQSTNPKQTIQRAIDPSRLPFYAQAWGNRPPPGLRLDDSEQVSHNEEPLQKQTEPLQRKENNTGLPDTLKGSVEGLSGMTMDDVHVHYNSSKPAEVQALAYTQGTEIHVGPGQEQHLAHEAWHVVQQKQGRVQATMQMKGVAINDDQGLEGEADELGARAAQSELVSSEQLGQPPRSDLGIVQRAKRKAPPPRELSKRQKKPSLQTIFDDMPVHFEVPEYTAETVHAHAGGKHSEAVLSPVCDRGLNTDANRNLPQAIRPAKIKYPDKHFKAGHLLNANFFGDGQDADNLTIITASANTKMTTFDNNIKNAVAELKKLYTALFRGGVVDISGLEFGIRVVVKVSDTKWGTVYPDDCITTEVTCEASLDGDLPDLTDSQQELHDNIETFINTANDASPIDNT